MVNNYDPQKDKYLQQIISQVERKAKYENKKRVILNALNTKHFMENQEAKDMLLNLLEEKKNVSQAHIPTHEDTFVQSTFEKSNTPKTQPKVIYREKQESIEQFGFRLMEAKRYEEALNMFLSHLPEEASNARHVAKRWLQDQKILVAKTIFDHLKGKEEHVRTLAECGKLLGGRREKEARTIIDAWTCDLLRKYDHLNTVTHVKKGFFRKKISRIKQEIIPPIDGVVCLRLMEGLETFGCANEAKSIFELRSAAPKKKNSTGNIPMAMQLIYNRFTKLELAPN